MTIPWGPLGLITYKRTYSRKKDDGTSEQFPETIKRVLDATHTQLDCGFTQAERDELEGYMLNLKCSVAGRFLWQLGTETVAQNGLLSLQNCASCVVNEPIRPFTWTMDCLMLGSGVGYNIQKEYVNEIPRPSRATITRQDTNDADFIVPDSREGWVALLHRTLEAHFTDSTGFNYSTQLVRSKGATIKGFGGVASGPEELCWGITEISTVLNKRAGKKLRPIDCLDIMNIIGYVVVAGNVRRSAQIAVGDLDDLQYLNAKRWDLGTVPKWRAMSNNSVACNDFSYVPDQLWEGYTGDGEPYGFINLKLAKTVGRTGETEYPDPSVAGVNPCAEQFLADKETCCLAEIFLSRVKSAEELWQITKYLYIICKRSLTLPCHHKDTEKIVHENMRMGIGVAGYLEASPEQRGWLSANYERLREFDVTYSKDNGLNISVKLTTVKPGGTLPLLPGVLSGASAGKYAYYIRRIQIASDSHLVDVCRRHGIEIEKLKNMDGTINPNTINALFPCRTPEGVVTSREVSAIDQLETVADLQADWSDNAVSCTIDYNRDELPYIRRWLKENYNTRIKSVSFLLRDDSGFEQMPYEEISAAKYQAMVAASTTITSIDTVGEDEIDLGNGCSGGMCPVK